MLADSKLKKKFWAEAINTATLIRNRSPEKSLECVPVEMWTGRRPDVRMMKVFGCDAYSHVHKSERGKLDNKTRKCWMMWYGKTSKGYRLYDRVNRKVFRSRDVTFEEGREKVDDLGMEEKEIVQEEEEEDKTNTYPENEEELEESVDEEARTNGGEIRRQSGRKRKAPQRYGEWVNVAGEEANPKTVMEAERSSNASKWEVAIDGVNERRMDSSGSTKGEDSAGKSMGLY